MTNKDVVSNDSNLYKIRENEGEIQTLGEFTKNNSTGKAADDKTFLLNGTQKGGSDRNMFLKKSVENPSNSKIFTPFQVEKKKKNKITRWKN